LNNRFASIACATALAGVFTASLPEAVHAHQIKIESSSDADEADYTFYSTPEADEADDDRDQDRAQRLE
jgi:hypothetical protein